MMISDVSTPVTLKTLRTSKGEYVLKGDPEPRMPEKGDLYSVRYFKLYKKDKLDGLDTFQLVGAKEEKSLVNGFTSFISIKKESYDAKTGRMTEKSAIHSNVFGGKNLECVGDVFKLQGSVSTKVKSNKVRFSLDTTVGELTPMAKRILKFFIR